MSLGNNGGRPSKFTPERVEEILKAVKRGHPFELIAQSNMIGISTLEGWITQGRKDLEEGIDSEFAKFSGAIAKIWAEAIELNLHKTEAGAKGWQGAFAVLQTHPRSRRYFSANGDAIEKFEKQLSAIEEKLNSFSTNTQE